MLIVDIVWFLNNSLRFLQEHFSEKTTELQKDFQEALESIETKSINDPLDILKSLIRRNTKFFPTQIS